MIKDVGEFLLAITTILFRNDERNFYLAYTFWFVRCFGLIGLMFCLNEALFLRYLTKIIYKRIIIMNDALIGTWIKLSNMVVTLLLAVIQSQGMVFQRNLEQFTKVLNPNDYNFSGGLNVYIPFWLGIFHMILTIVIFLHVCTDKIKQKNTTPVLHIHIPNPQAPVNNLFTINNQTYNQDLIDVSSYLILVLTAISIFISFSLVGTLDLDSTLAIYFQVPFNDFFTVFDLSRRFSHALVLGFLIPLLLILLSSELRPFLFKCLSRVSLNNPIYQVNY